jgi:hypothetical protein
MSILISVLKDELDRNHRAQHAYQKELALYPKGSLVIKKRKSMDYFYLAYRDASNRIKTDYIGNVQNPKVKQLQQQIQKRQEIIEILKVLKHDEGLIRRMLKQGGTESEGVSR